MARGTMRVLAIHFPRGAIAFERGGAVTRRASVDVPPGEVRGANGAGDAFAAGMMYALHEGWDVERRARARPRLGGSVAARDLDDRQRGDVARVPRPGGRLGLAGADLIGRCATPLPSALTRLGERTARGRASQSRFDAVRTVS